MFCSTVACDNTPQPAIAAASSMSTFARACGSVINAVRDTIALTSRKLIRPVWNISSTRVSRSRSAIAINN